MKKYKKTENRAPPKLSGRNPFDLLILGISRGTTSIHDPPFGVFLDPPLSKRRKLEHIFEQNLMNKYDMTSTQSHIENCPLFWGAGVKRKITKVISGHRFVAVVSQHEEHLLDAISG